MANIRPRPGDADAARRLFFDKGESPNGLVPDIIARSWARCAQQLDNARTAEPYRVDSSVLDERREARGRLRRIVEPEMDALAELVCDSGSLVLLADADGLILDAAGGLDFLHKAQRVALQPGVDWSEPGRGTNAIGTALVESEAVAVKGRQHYLDTNGILSCAAAPLLSPRGELLGVLDVSGGCEQLHCQALGMVRLATQVIEHRLVKDAPRAATLLRFHYRPELLGSYREAVLVLDDTRVVGANRAALQLLGASWKALLDSSAEHWLQLPAHQGSAAQLLREARGGRQFHGIIDSAESLRVPVAINTAGSDGEAYIDADTAALLDQARRVLDAGVAVLVNGETGVGKEVFARRLHAASRRSQGPFVAVNCAALPESLIESELFGYESGAFTGARRGGMPGRVREADGGILFLDEIGDMPLALQARLLRVLQERKVLPLGGQPVAVDFDLVCATNHDLGTLVESGRFRADLYYRIQDFTLRLPPLRERADRRHIIDTLMARLGGSTRDVSLSEAAMQRLTAYAWPGNMRQLTSTLRMLLALADRGERIGPAKLPEDIRQHRAAPAASNEDNALQEVTRQAIDRALAECDGNVSAAARQLGIHRSTIYRWLDRQRQ